MRSLLKFLTVLLLLSFTSADIQEKGASEGKDLPGIVFHAMKLHDFDQLVNYIPGDHEIEYLKNSASKKSRYLFDQTETERLKAEARISFDKAIEEGVKRQVNWSDAQIMDSGIEKTDSPDKRISKGWFIIQDARENQMKVSFDIIKVKNKWFAFREFKVDN